MTFKSFLQNKISLYLCRHRNVQKFYIANADKITAIEKSDRAFYDVNNEKDFFCLCDKFGFTVPDADVKQRFDSGSHFCVLTENDFFGCWGWYALSGEFYVLEIDRRDCIPDNAAVLYHYFTNENFRRKGFYTELLKNVVLSTGRNFSIIYAYDTNPASWKAIEKSGFEYLGTFIHKNFPGFSSITQR